MPPRRVVCLDTFDGRIAANGGQLLQAGEGTTARLEWHPSARRLRTRTSTRTAVAFVWDLPPGAVATQLRPIVGVRRLLPMVELVLGGHTLDVLDNRSKTVARITVAAGRARRARRGRWHAMPTLVTVAGLPSRNEESRRVRALVERRPGLQHSRAGLQALGVRAVGATLPPDVSQVGMGLSASLRANAGAAEVHRRLLAVMRANEAGLREDLDTEFLHTYRVALRRTRSLLGQIKDVFPADRVEYFREEFRWLGAVTGPTRDLDVLMLALRLVPGDRRGHISTLRRDITERHRRARRASLRPRVFRQLRRFCAHRTRLRFRRLRKASSKAVAAAVGDRPRRRPSSSRRPRG
jgi:hypothetical protein